jgi:AcrR family transcriptional regulator
VLERWLPVPESPPEADELSDGVRRPGRPRSERSKASTLAAAGELLLQHGLEAVSMDAIAVRAGVSKATIYRWWPTKETLAIDALFEDWEAAYPVAPDTGRLRDDLSGVFVPWVDHIVKRPYARVLGALLTRARTDDAFAREFDSRLVQPRRDRARLIFHRAIARTELAADTDVELGLDLLYGPVYHRFLQGHLPISREFVEAVIDVVLSGLLPRE